MGSTTFKDITGQRFRRLVAIRRVGSTKNKTTKWLCKCDCGNYTVVASNELRRKEGNGRKPIESCGCYRKEIDRSSFDYSKIKTHGMAKTPIYNIWSSIKTRCADKDDKDYGGRGISVCEKWHTFEGFYEDMGQTYKQGLSIDRKDVNGNYCKENCKWSTNQEQANNKRTNRLVVINGETDTMANMCRKYNITRAAIYHRIQRGNTIEEAFARGVIR